MRDVIVGVVLAAGSGRRYGMPKILAHQGNWLRCAVAAVGDGGCDEVAVTMGAAVVAPPEGARAAVVADWSLGLSASVRVALADAVRRPEVAGVVLHVVDTPDVDSRVVARILKAAAHRRSALVRATYHRRPGHPVWIGADHFGGVLTVLDGDTGAQRYFRGRTDVLVVECGDLATGADHDVSD